MEVTGEVALAEFRRCHLAGSAFLDSIEARAPCATLANLVPGAGKSFAIDAITLAALIEPRYDLVIIACPTRRTLEERQLVRNPRPDIRSLVLYPRPRERCGIRDEQWASFEPRGLGLLGRRDLCGSCPERATCPWFDQYTAERMHGAQAIYLTHALLLVASGMLEQIIRWVGATRVLLLVDEADLTMASVRRRIAGSDIEGLRVAVGRCDPALSPDLETLAARLVALQQTTTEGLRSPDWQLPRLGADVLTAVLDAGYRHLGASFSNIYPALLELVRSPVESRYRDAFGTLSFTAIPRLGCDVAIFSATADPGIVSHRLGLTVQAPFADVHIRHPGTVWLNVSSSCGTRRNLANTLADMIDLFAKLIWIRIQADKRVVIVTKQAFEMTVAEQLEARIHKLGGAEIRCHGRDWPKAAQDPHGIPVIHYGMQGFNDLEAFDAIYCLGSYLIPESVLSDTLQDMLPDDGRIGVTISTCGIPRRRRAAVVDASHRFTDVAQLAQRALIQLEMGTVLQAVSRVRPFTSAREVITMQPGEFPGITYTHEFSSLGGLRQHFGLTTVREDQHQQSIHDIQRLRDSGLSQSRVAQALNISTRTVKRNWRSEDLS